MTVEELEREITEQDQRGEITTIGPAYHSSIGKAE